jgi:hypothetical protein
MCFRQDENAGTGFVTGQNSEAVQPEGRDGAPRGEGESCAGLVKSGIRKPLSNTDRIIYVLCNYASFYINDPVQQN